MHFETRTSVLQYGTTNNCLYYTIIWVNVLQQREVDLRPLASKLMDSMNNLNECSFRCLYCVKQTTWALTCRSSFSRRFVGSTFSRMLLIIEEDTTKLGGELHPYWHNTLAKHPNEVTVRIFQNKRHGRRRFYCWIYRQGNVKTINVGK